MMISLFASSHRITTRRTVRTGFQIKNLSAAASATFDVVVVGGGIVGSALAGRLAKDIPSLKIALVEAGTGPSNKIVTSQPPNPRSYALSLASMKTLGLEKSDIATFGGPYESMQVWEEGQPAPLIWSAIDDLPRNVNSNEDSMLGACFEDHTLQSFIWNKYDFGSENVSLFTNSTVDDVQLNSENPDAWIDASIAFSNDDANHKIRTRLLVAADGGRSRLRDSVFQIKTNRIDYQQSALTGTVRLESPLRGRAFQRFLNTGPLALLTTRCPNHAVFVWTMPKEMAQQMKEQTENALVTELNRQLQVGLEPIPPMLPPNMCLPFQNEIHRLLDTLHFAPSLASSTIDNFRAAPMIQSLATPAVSFPLATQMANTFTTRSGGVLIGDAAHSVHPLAGQGLNLGLSAVQVLVDAVREQSTYHDVRAALPKYEMHLRTHQTAAVASIHAIQRIFRESSPLAKHGKSLGMNMVQSLPPIRRALVRAACFGSPL